MVVVAVGVYRGSRPEKSNRAEMRGVSRRAPQKAPQQKKYSVNPKIVIVKDNDSYSDVVIVFDGIHEQPQ